MQIKWLNPDMSFDKLLLAGDIGGTNSNLALVGVSKKTFTILLEVIFASSEICGLIDPLKTVLTIGKERLGARMQPSLCCISAAGAVVDNGCNLTNCSWSVNGTEIENALGIPTLVINDFLAVSYGLLTFDVSNPQQIHTLKHPDGSVPAKQQSTIAVIGPGTGLGVSFLVCHKGEYVPACSEGGHCAFAPFDEESEQFWKYMFDKTGTVPGVELFVSGQGVKNIFYFYKDVKNIPIEGLLLEIDVAADSHKPGKISRGAHNDEYCHSMMQLFVRMFASAASNLACTTLPFGGLYLAGGTVIKDLKWLEEDDLFMTIFEKNYNRNIVPLLKKVPVYVVKDYSISLYGAANAALNMMGKVAFENCIK